MAHAVDIDDDAIHAERASLSGEYISADPGGDSSGEDAGPSHGYQRWYGVVSFLGPQAHGLLCPNWDIDPQGADIMREGMVEQLVSWFPNGIPGFDDMELDSPWLKILAGAGLIAAANFDLSTMTMRPLRQPPPPPKREGEGTHADAAAG